MCPWRNIEIAHRIAKENIQRAQQRMKDYHDLHAVPVKYQVGEQVWVYTPRNHKGLSKKLAHNNHGPYRIVKFLSPVHCILHATDNRRISTTVHVSRLKPYISPDTHPICQPPELVDEPYLAEEDFPADSFLVEQHAGLPESQTSDPASLRRSPRTQPPDGVQAPDDKATSDLQGSGSADTKQSEKEDVYQVEKILEQRQLNVEHQFLIKWLGFPHSHNTWEPVSNINDERSIAQFYKQHPRAKFFDDDPDYQP